VKTTKYLFSREKAQEVQKAMTLDGVLEDVLPNFEVQFHFEPFVPFCG
jgi:hypothetical protein